MGYGLQVKNDKGALQIDSEHINYVLYEHGESVSTSEHGPFGGPEGVYIYWADVTFSTATATPVLIAIKPSSSNYCGLAHYRKTGSNYIGFRVYSESDTVVTFDWQAFIPKTVGSSEAYGLRVYNNEKAFMYDSGEAPLIITDVDVVSPSYPDGVISVVNLTHPSDEDAYFIVFNGQGYWYTCQRPGEGEYAHEWMHMMKYINATTLSFGGVDFIEDPCDLSIWSLGYWADEFTIATVKKAF